MSDSLVKWCPCCGAVGPQDAIWLDHPRGCMQPSLESTDRLSVVRWRRERKRDGWYPEDVDWLLNELAECRDALDTAWEEIGALQTVCRDAGLVLYNVPRTDDKDWSWRANAVLTLIDEVLPGGIP